MDSRRMAGLWTTVKWREVAEAVGRNSHSPSPQLALPGANSPPSSISAPSSNEESSSAELSSAPDSLPAEDPAAHNPPSSQSSASSRESGAGKVLSVDGEKNLRSFLRAIDQSRLAQPIFAWEKLKVLSWLGDNQQNGKRQKREEVGHFPPKIRIFCRQIPIGIMTDFMALGLLPACLKEYWGKGETIGGNKPPKNNNNWPEEGMSGRELTESIPWRTLATSVGGQAHSNGGFFLFPSPPFHRVSVKRLAIQPVSALLPQIPPSPLPSPFICPIGASFQTIIPPFRPFFAVSFRFPPKIRRKSDPAFFWRNAANLAMSSGGQMQSSVETSTEQLIRKWSTKSNSSGAEQLRTLREQLGDGKRSAGNVAKGRSSSSSCSSRPHLPFLVQQSDSAIGSSLDGSFSFLPPPPPYRPPRPASGSDGAIGTQQRQQVPRGQDFTSLLGFDLVKTARGQMGPNGEEETQQKRTNEKKGEMAGTIRMAGQGTEKRNSGEKEGGGGGGAAGTTTDSSKPMPKREKPVAAAAALALAFRASQTSSQVSLLSPSPSAMSFSEYPELQEKVQKLQASRENLNLQVAVLSQQVSLQREKIRDLESLLESSRRNSRESIPGLAQELAELQHKYLALERDKLEAERRLRLSNSELERISEQAALPPPSNGQQPPQPPKHHLQQQQPLQNGLGNGGGVSRAEMDRLQMAIQRLMADNEQKDSMIQSLRIALDEQQRRLTHQANGSLEEHFPGGQPHSFDINDQIRRLLLEEDAFGPSGHPMAHSSSFPLALCSSQSPAGLPPAPGNAPIRHQNILPSSNSFSSALAHQQAFAAPPPLWRVTSPPAIPPHLGQSPRTPASPLARQLAAELDELRRSGTVASGGGLGIQPQQMHSNQQQQPYSSASLPRSIHSKSNSLGAAPNPSKHSNSSIPPTHFESDDECGSRSSAFAATNQSNGGQSNGNKNFKRGRRARSTFRSFLDRFAHRGNSMQDLRPSPRPSPAPSSISASGPIPLRPPIRQFVDWDQPKCARWLAELGFQDCAFAVIRSGRHLLNMNDGELERELGIRSALQRKRLRGILGRMERGGDFEPADRMDTNQVMLWLDLIGLPQYRDLFAECRMDGHLLLALSAQDLLELGIHSALNHASLARGIQFLRSAEFHLHRLERHFHQDFLGHSPIPAEVEHWSHGCTLEWLCNVDLAEFTPNLVFSGLHGALMVLEPTFTAESLAEMLQIPPQKTLLRRHLTSQFNSLLGQQVVSHKRDVLGQPFVTHLTPSLRIRLAKKGFSLTRKKSKSDIFVEPEVRVCPEETNGEEMSEV